MFGRITLTMPASPAAVGIAEATAGQFAKEAGIPSAETAVLVRVVRCLVTFSVERSYEGRGGGDVELSFELDDLGVAVDVHDWGIPMRRSGGPDGPLPPGLEEAEAAVQEVHLINLANDGKRIALHLSTPHQIPIAARVIDGAADATRSGRGVAIDDIVIRDATLVDSTAIAQLLYRGYAFNYRHRDFYTPSWVDAQFRGGHVFSTVAYVDDQLVGHHAILVDAPNVAAESGVAVIDRAWRGLGIFDVMFAHTVARARLIGLPALYGRATCSHVYSQRSELKNGYREAALMLGGSPSVMAQEQLGEAEALAVRGANLVSYLRLADQVERSIAAPTVYRDELARLFEHLGLVAVGVDSAAVPAIVPDAVHAEVEDGTAQLWLSGPQDAHELDRRLRSEGARLADVLYADVDLTLPADDGVAVLRDNGFFLAGLVNAGRDGRDWLRLQRPQADAQITDLHLEGEVGRWLLECVLADRELVG